MLPKRWFGSGNLYVWLFQRQRNHAEAEDVLNKGIPISARICRAWPLGAALGRT